jgi:hypothetical protein
MPARHRSSRRLFSVRLLVAALAAVACNPPAPTASTQPSTAPPTAPTASPVGSQPPAAEVYAAIRRDVESIRGLQPTVDVDPVTIDEAQLRTNLEAEFDKENSADDLKFSEQSLMVLGLLPAGSSLRALILDFQGSQVAGYYSPDKKELFVVSRSGKLGPAEEVTYAHEFTHQLQDQRFDLSKLGEDAANQSDRALAQLSLIEGDAVSVQTTWTIQNLTPEEMGQLLQASLDPAGIEALRRAPPYLRETALFPYQGGLSYVTGLISSGGYDAVNGAFAKPPDSTEQVLHPEKFAQREAPVRVQLPANLASGMGSGWTEGGQDTLGEFVLRLWLTQNNVPSAGATTAAAGWGGDRLVLLRGPSGGTTVGLVTMWDTEEDAREFSDAATTAIGGLGTIQTRGLLSGRKAVVLAIGDGAKKLLPLIGDVAALGQ